jgi:hypothetical protein
VLLPLLGNLQPLLQMHEGAQQVRTPYWLCWQMLRSVGLVQQLLRAAEWLRPLTSTGSYQTALWALRQLRLERRAKRCCSCQCQHQQQSGQGYRTRNWPVLLAAGRWLPAHAAAVAARLASLQWTAAEQLL